MLGEKMFQEANKVRELLESELFQVVNDVYESGKYPIRGLYLVPAESYSRFHIYVLEEFPELSEVMIADEMELVRKMRPEYSENRLEQVKKVIEKSYNILVCEWSEYSCLNSNCCDLNEFIETFYSELSERGISQEDKFNNFEELILQVLKNVKSTQKTEIILGDSQLFGVQFVDQINVSFVNKVDSSLNENPQLSDVYGVSY